MQNYNEFLTKINSALSKSYDGDRELSDVLPKAEYTTFESDNAWLKILEYQKIITMRQEWSGLFKVVVISILIFEILLTACVGFGWLNFEDEWFVRLIILGGFAQLLTMPYTITQFLFSTNSLNNKD